MTSDQKKSLAWIITAIVLTAISAFLGVNYPVPAEPWDEPEALGTTHFGSDIVLTGDLSVGDALTVSGLTLPSFTNETITTGETLTPAYTVYALDTSGAVTMTLAATGTEGQLLILIGDDANTITVNDTNIRTSTGSTLAIGQYDVAGFVFQDSEWLELFLIADS